MMEANKDRHCERHAPFARIRVTLAEHDAKQSRRQMDRFVASLLAMTGPSNLINALPPMDSPGDIVYKRRFARFAAAAPR